MTRNKAAFLFLLLPSLLSAENLNSIFEGSPRASAFPLLKLQDGKPKDEEIESWLEDLGSEDAIKREGATNLLFKNFKHTKEQIKKRLDDKGDPEIQGRLKWILKEAPRDPRARELESKLPMNLRIHAPADLADKTYSNKEEDFAEVLELINNSRFISEETRDILSKPILDHLLKGVEDWKKLKKETKCDILWLLLINHKIDAAYSRPLINLLSDQDHLIRRDALQVIIWTLPIEKEEIRQIALKMLKDSNGYVVAMAISALKRYEITEEKERVKELRNHPHPWVLFNCFEYFKELFEKGPDAVSIGEQILRNLPEPTVTKDGFKYKETAGLTNVMNAFNEWDILKNYRKELETIASDPLIYDRVAARAWLKELDK